MNIKVTMQLESQEGSPYSQGRHIDQSDKRDKETADEFEKRSWPRRLNVNEAGQVFIPPAAIKNGLTSTAKYRNESIKGKGKQTYTKKFTSGTLVIDPIVLHDGKGPVLATDVEGEWLFVPADGRRGGTTRVPRCFPKIPHWTGEAVVYILDETITQDIFEKYMKDFGNLIGVGRFRPESNGFYGRFKVLSVNWEPQE